jgi:hypothetical protein
MLQSSNNYTRTVNEVCCCRVSLIWSTHGILHACEGDELVRQGLGYGELDWRGAELLFQVLAEREE